MPRKLSDREKKFLEILDANPTINSGATFGDADGILSNYSGRYGIEVKSTDAKSFSIKLETWKKVKRESNRIGLEPILAIDIQGERLIVLSNNQFLTLLDICETGMRLS